MAVITGGSRGIGRGIGVAFAREGVHILFSYVSNKEAADKTKREIQSFGEDSLQLAAGYASIGSNWADAFRSMALIFRTNKKRRAPKKSEREKECHDE